MLRVVDTSSAASSPIALDEFSAPQTPGAAASLLSTMLLTGVVLPGSDAAQGTLGRSGDGLGLLFVGLDAQTGAPTVVRVNRTGSVALAGLGAASGLGLGACAVDGTGAHVVGGGLSLGYVAEGAALVSQTYPSGYADARWTACAAARAGGLLLLRLSASAGLFIDSVAAPAPAAALMEVVQGPPLAAAPRVGKQVLANAAGTRIYVAVQTAVAPCGMRGIYVGAAADAPTPGFRQNINSSFLVTGLALSADEATLFFTASTAAAASALFSKRMHAPRQAWGAPPAAALRRELTPGT